MNWILVATVKPLLAFGPAGKPPTTSEDVLLYFGPPDGREIIAIGNYNAEEDGWYVTKGLDMYFLVDGDPTHWMPLPELPIVRTEA